MMQTLLLKDEAQLELECEILKQVIVDDETYALVMPVHQPVQILMWDASQAEDSLMDLDPDEQAAVFDNAQAVLAELNLKLIESAYTLTVSGDLPEPNEEDIFEIASDDDDIEEYFLLTKFYKDTNQFGIFAPLDPLIFFAAQPEDEAPYLLSPEDDMALLERLQDQLLDLADGDGAEDN